MFCCCCCCQSESVQSFYPFNTHQNRSSNHVSQYQFNEFQLCEHRRY
jgi:hypothetical protein